MTLMSKNESKQKVVKMQQNNTQGVKTPAIANWMWLSLRELSQHLKITQAPTRAKAILKT